VLDSDSQAPTAAGGGVRDLLTVDGLTVSIGFETGLVPVIEDVYLQVRPGEIVGLVGETGCGKSMTALAILGLLPRVAHPTGSIRLAGRELIGLSERALRRIRGAQIGYVAHDATAALNPVLMVGRQITESIRAHTGVSRREARERACELLRSVGIPEPRARLFAYPHQLSGGMRQRVGIAIALAGDPRLVVADEPTTALDATVQAQIIDLLLSAAASRQASVLLISHDLRMVGGVTDRVNVMYAGRIVEQDTSGKVMRTPSHPYTSALLGSTPRIRGERSRRLTTIEGRPPDPRALPSGCRFHPRCPAARPACAEEEPLIDQVGSTVACWFPLIGDSHDASGSRR
jgi:oligopeptide/dipeptide ABC transporter ATP-binding protein